MAFLENKGRRIYWERHGEPQNPAILFLHGAGSNAATWWQQLPAFQASGFTCLTMDIRCFGRSAAPLDEFTFEHMVADALAVLDAAEVKSAAVAGQSLGGMIALRMALQHPERVKAFISCDSSLGVDHPGVLETIRNRQITMQAASIEQRSLGPWFLANHPDKAALYAQINHFNPSAHSVPATQWGGALGRLMEPGHLLALEALRGVTQPTLFVVGRQDPIVSPEVTGEFAERVPGSEVVVVEESGHSAYFEQPARFNARVLGFLKTVS